MVNRDNSQFAYTASSGNTPTSQIIYETRDPNQYDVYYSLRTQWVNSVSKNFWYLNNQSNASGQLLSTWVQISGGGNVAQSISDTANSPVYFSSSSAIPPNNVQLVGGAGITIVSTPASNLLTITNTNPAAETLTGDDGVAVSPTGGGTINTIGNVVANSTHSKALFTTNSSANTEQWDIQLSAAIVSTDVTKVGLSAFSNAQFGVDTNGFVTLKGGTTPSVLGLIPDNHTAPGTSPVVPDSSGDITITAAQITNAGLAHVINTISLAANAVTLQIQQSGSAPSADSTKNGVAHFNNAQFNVDSLTGFVSLTGGSGGAFTQIVSQVFTNSATYTPTTGMFYCIVEAVGGGGGGGGADSTGATESSAASGGAGGGYCRKVFAAATIGVSQVVTIGSAGTGGAAGNNTGVAGGNTTFGALLTANGGAGGLGSAAVTVSRVTASSVNGGTATGGDVNISGGPSVYGATVIVTAGSNSYPIAGGGGNSFYGQGGSDASNAPGNPAVGYGSGGGGASCGISNGTGYAGSNGAAGIVIVTEFI